jgi:hypothetical protein
MEQQAIVTFRCVSPATNNAIRHPEAVLDAGKVFKLIRRQVDLFGARFGLSNLQICGGE